MRGDLEAVVAAVVAARASALGRAPMVTDGVKAVGLLDLDSASAPSFAGVAHDRARLASIVGAIPREQLIA